MPEITSNPFFRVLELWQAAYSGDAPKLQALLADPILRDKINYKMKSQGNHTVLFAACYGAANAETVKILINAGADPFLRDNNGRLPLHFAANTKDKELIAALLETPNMKSFRLDTASDTGQTPFHALFLPSLGVDSAVKSKNADLSSCLPLFLEVSNDPLGALRKKDNKGLSPLTFVKHYNLKSAFYPHVPPKTFEILLKSVVVPANIEELLKPEVSTFSLELAIDDNENIFVDANEHVLERRSLKTMQK